MTLTMAQARTQIHRLKKKNGIKREHANIHSHTGYSFALQGIALTSSHCAQPKP